MRKTWTLLFLDFIFSLKKVKNKYFIYFILFTYPKSKVNVPSLFHIVLFFYKNKMKRRKTKKKLRIKLRKRPIGMMYQPIRTSVRHMRTKVMKNALVLLLHFTQSDKLRKKNALKFERN